MSTIGYLADDFKSVALSDLQVDINITHYVKQVLNPVTGSYSNTIVTEDGKGIIDSLTKKDTALFPDRLTLRDKKLYVNAADFSFQIEKGNKIQIGSSIFTVVEIADLDNVLLLYIRRH